MEATDFLTKQKFSILVEKRSSKKNMTHLQSILELCDEFSIDIETVSKYITPTLKKKIEIQCKSANLLQNDDTPQKTTLTINTNEKIEGEDKEDVVKN